MFKCNILINPNQCPKPTRNRRSKWQIKTGGLLLVSTAPGSMWLGSLEPAPPHDQLSVQGRAILATRQTALCLDWQSMLPSKSGLQKAGIRPRGACRNAQTAPRPFPACPAALPSVLRGQVARVPLRPLKPSVSRWCSGAGTHHHDIRWAELRLDGSTL